MVFFNSIEVEFVPTFQHSLVYSDDVVMRKLVFYFKKRVSLNTR